MSKFVVVDLPLRHPAKCIGCGANSNRDGRKFVDLTFVNPQCTHGHTYGAVYLCSLCLAEVVGGLGWLSPEKAREIMWHNKQRAEKIHDLEVENASLHRTVRELAFLYPASDSSNGNSPDARQGDTRSARNEDGTDEIASRGSNEPEESEQGSSKSPNEQGHSGVFSNDDIAKLIDTKF